MYMLLLLLLSHFSRVQLCVTPETAAHQAPPSLGFSRQEHEWVAISFSNAWKWKVKVKSLSRIWLIATPWTAAYQAPPSMGLSRQEYWSGVPLPSPTYVYTHTHTHTHIYIYKINNKDLLYSTGNYIQYPVIISNGKGSEENTQYTHTHTYV